MTVRPGKVIVDTMETTTEYSYATVGIKLEQAEGHLRSALQSLLEALDYDETHGVDGGNEYRGIVSDTSDLLRYVQGQRDAVRAMVQK